MRVPGRLMFFLGLLLGLVCAAIFVWTKGIDVTRLPHGTGGVVFTDRTGLPLGTIYASDDDHAAWIPIKDIAPQFIAAILAAEDARFYQHGAIDFAALGRALRDYITYGEPRSGGSTIAMQLARSLHPTPSTIRGKLAQILYAEQIALRSSRTAILEAYLNRIPMGGNLYGVEAASRTYFGISSHDLDLAQAALLASIPNDPNRYYPYASVASTGFSSHEWHALRSRQRYVLDRMVADGAITTAQRDVAKREEIDLLPPTQGLTEAQHLLFWLYPRVPRSTTTVRTTIDASLQRFVQAQVEQVVTALQARHVTDAAAIVIDNHTGDVLAYAGSPDYFADSVLGRNDGVQALRQPGSSLKPFTYELALERGAIVPNSILLDVPATYAIPGGKLYTPADYSTQFAGPVRVRYALANSLNVPAVRILSRTGVNTFLDRLHDLGFSRLNKSAAYYGLGLTLGSGEVSLWELSHAYMTIARTGNMLPLRTIVAENTTAFFPSANPHRQIGNPSLWLLITDMLADPHARAKSFGLHSVLEMPFPAAVKTGTSSDFRDTWTVGFTRDYTVGVWVGNFDGSPMRGVSGVTGAGPLWNRIMLHLHETSEPAPFPDPPGYIRTPICATTGDILSNPQTADVHAQIDDRTCPAVVTEWLKPTQIAHGMTSCTACSSGRKPAFAIVSPHDGDTFVLTPSDDPVAKNMQRIALQSSRSQGTHWNVNGLPASPGFWPLRLGTWRISATNGRQTAQITIHVVRPPRNPRPGFTFR